MEDAIVIGSGPAGLTAALYLSRAGFPPLVLAGMLPGGQLTTTTDIENFPGFPEPIPGFELMQRMQMQATRYGARIEQATAVSAALAAKPFAIQTDDGRELVAACVIIATGAAPRYLGLESEQKLAGRGVSVCATCDGALYRGKPVAVVGGGDAALEEALFLARFASRVTIIHRRASFRASRILVDRAAKHPMIRMLLDSVVADVLGVERNEVAGLLVRNSKTGETSVLDVKGVFIAIGRQPNSSIFRGQLELDDKGFIVTRNTRTSVEGVFAAGDVQDTVYRQAITAAASGCMAAIEAARYLSEVRGSNG